jgi:hypothetical protein
LRSVARDPGAANRRMLKIIARLQFAENHNRLHIKLARRRGYAEISVP